MIDLRGSSANMEKLLRIRSGPANRLKETVQRIKDIAHGNYWINTQKCITKPRKPIASGIFDIFGHFESWLASEARDEMIEWALEHKEELGETA